jgi:L-malate glycosyltransferase
MDELLSAVKETGSRRPASPRICLIIGQLGLGGTEKQVVLLAEGLARSGIDVTVVVLKGGEEPREPALRAAGVPVVHIGLKRPSGWRELPYCLVATWRLTRYLRQARPDVVHAFLYHAYVLGAVAAWCARIPVLLAGRRALDDFTRGRPLVLAAERVATGLTDLLVANARAVADCAHATERVPPRKLVVIYNGLPESAFVPARPARLATTRPVVLCVANLRLFKGHADLLRAAAMLRDRGMPCTVALAGDGPEREALRRLAAELGVDARLLGPRTDVDALLARADVVVLPSLTEGLSNAVMEAMAAGRPVVATAVGGTPELLADGRGVLVPPGDPWALADALGAVLAGPEYAWRLGEEARRWSREHLRADTMVARHVALYDELWTRSCAA